MIDPARVTLLKGGQKAGGGPLFYWMTREQRFDENWALLFAQERARELGRELRIVFFLEPSPREGTERRYVFMVQGLIALKEEAERRGIPFFVLPRREEVRFWKMREAQGQLAELVCDFYPLRPFREQQERAAAALSIPVWQVDGHNVIPCHFISSKQEYSAHTLRRKMEPLLPRFLTEIPRFDGEKRETRPDPFPEGLDLPALKRLIEGRETPAVKGGFLPGMKRMGEFWERGYENYTRDRNNPLLSGQSGLSPYLHFGQIAPQTVVFEAARISGSLSLKGSFLDEVLVRRELSDNYCFYNSPYDREEGFPPWARKTLQDHEGDERFPLYDLEELEAGKTGEDLWNAAQRQLVYEGKMHGFMRMYWAKKILEWSRNSGEAMERAVYLNDKYSLDGEDPNGYAGCAWAIGGVHDRAWAERPIFGKIRYMNERGCRRKFSVDDYVERYLS